jgi:hypothetical protein
MPTRIHFLNEKTLDIDEDLDTIAFQLAQQGAARVHQRGSDRGVMVFTSAMTYAQEQRETDKPLVSG